MNGTDEMRSIGWNRTHHECDLFVVKSGQNLHFNSSNRIPAYHVGIHQLQACFVLLHPCLRILLAIYSEATACMRQLMCTAVRQLSSDQLVPLHHHAHFIYPACLRVGFVYASDMKYSCRQGKAG
jgi:hypothetical protein